MVLYYRWCQQYLGIKWTLHINASISFVRTISYTVLHLYTVTMEIWKKELWILIKYLTFKCSLSAIWYWKISNIFWNIVDFSVYQVVLVFWMLIYNHLIKFKYYHIKRSSFHIIHYIDHFIWWSHTHLYRHNLFIIPY